MIYLIAWSTILGALILSRWQGPLSKAAVISAGGVVTCVAVLRGGVGTDTESYEYWAGAVRTGAGLAGAEPGFGALLNALTWIFESDQTVIRAVSLIYALLILVAYRNSEKDERFLLLAFVVPAYFFLHSMNVLRLGLASAILILAAQNLRHQRVARFWLLGVLAMAFHYTSVAPLIFLWLMTSGGHGLKGRAIAIVATALAGAFLFFSQDWLGDKSQAYGDLQAPDELSGLSQLVILAFLLSAVAVSRLGFLTKSRLILASGLLATGGWMAARQSYAGLRALDLIVFVVPLSFIVASGIEGLRLNDKAKLLLIIAGIASVGAQFRGFVLNEGSGATPFLPYYSLFSD